MHSLLILIPALPLLAAVLTAVLGPKVLKAHSHWPTILALVTSCGLSLVLLSQVKRESESSTQPVGWETVVHLWSWADVAGATDGAAASGSRTFDVPIALRADSLSAIMLVMVTLVASLVAIYSAGYMRGDSGYWRFFAYVSLFVFSMVMLVSVSNFVLLYVFWEAVGVCSYLAIGFWYQKPEAAAAGKKAFLVNRVGDFGFALGLFLIWTQYGTLNFHDTTHQGEPAAASWQASENAEQPSVVRGVLGQSRLAADDFVGGRGEPGEQHVALAICLLLLLGACGKSAQFPLHVWLPDAMEGPTPVSALIHAATMVTAGVYMITRCTPLFLVSHDAQVTVACVGTLTALMAGLIALTQTDLKRILAYSTISQLGYMFLALGTGLRAGIVAGMFHLLTHAFFKSLLFLAAGSVRHAMGGVIDVRRFGGLRRLLPYTHGTFLIGALALAGVVPLSGFFSKDAILDAVHERAHEAHVYHWLFYAALLTAFITAIYTFRAFFMTFYGQQKIPTEAGHHAHESPKSMVVPLVVLAVCAAVVGPLIGSFARLLALTPSLAYVGAEATGPAYISIQWGMAGMSLAVAGFGIALAAFFYLGERKEVAVLAALLKPAYQLSYGKFYIDQIYTLLVVWPAKALAWLAYWFDRQVIDRLVNLCGAIPGALGTLLRPLQPGLVQFYAMLMVMGLVLLVLVGSLIM